MAVLSARSMTGADAVTHTTQLLTYDALGPRDLAEWSALAAAHPDYSNPHLGPEFSRHIAAIDPTTRVVLIRDGETLVGVIPVSLRRGGFARAVGAPFQDYSGPVLSQHFEGDLPRALAQAGLSAFRFNASPDPFGHLAPHALAQETGYRIDSVPGRPGADVLEDLRAKNARPHKNFRRLRNKLETDGLVLRLAMGAPEPDALDAALRWKSAQLVAAKRVDVINLPRGEAVLRHFRENAFDGQSGGYQITIYLNDAPAAVEFGVRAGASFQPWIAAYDPAFQAYSPGNQLMREFILRLHETGIAHYDLGTGHGDYKKYFCTHEVCVLSGTIYADSPVGRIRKARGRLSRAAGFGPIRKPVERLAGRADHIAAAEMRPGARLSLFARSVLEQMKR